MLIYVQVHVEIMSLKILHVSGQNYQMKRLYKLITVRVYILAPHQVEWPRPIRSKLHVESLKRPKHAVHDEWLGTFLMTIIKK